MGLLIAVSVRLSMKPCSRVIYRGVSDEESHKMLGAPFSQAHAHDTFYFGSYIVNASHVETTCGLSAKTYWVGI